ncbi:2-hydroxyhepta-2,4-diene-1,7-dioate isomerase [Chromatiales bacterium (ex Bugula neritina AB1)]|nr:2-hydroxyhepta-2,4-diene-1,7-dioate isomerase [Chromatiales bacterium (ex Bugula neritina AB1)]
MVNAKLASFSHQGTEKYGLIRDDGVVDLSARFASRWANLHQVIEECALRKLADDAQALDTDFDLAQIEYLIPITQPEKIICVGVNYPARNEEYKDGQEAPPYPSLFPRFARSFTGHQQGIVRAAASTQFDYEGEVVLVIGKAGRHISRDKALEHIAAVTLCNEACLRDWLRHAKFNVTQGKNFDSSGSIGPWLVPYESEEQIADIHLTTTVNGELRQDDRTSRMMFDFRYLINYISTFTTLVPGDIIVTGTPTGAGARFDPPKWLLPGDVVEVSASGIGTLSNTVVDEEVASV